MARDLDLHQKSAAQTSEIIVAGKKSGLMSLDDETTFEGRHFGFKLRHSARITVFEPPFRFRDEMTRGVFRQFWHDHEFLACENKTLMRDSVFWRSPLGIFGKLADFFIAAHLKRFLLQRAQFLALVAEKNQGQTPPVSTPPV